MDDRELRKRLSECQNVEDNAVESHLLRLIDQYGDFGTQGDDTVWVSIEAFDSMHWKSYWQAF